MSSNLLLGTYTSVTHLVEFTAPTPSSPPSLRLVKDLPISRASWITRHPSLRDIWYIAHEADDGGGSIAGVEGKVWVYRISPEGDVARLGEVSAVDNPCHIAVVGGGTGLASVNFAAGSASLFTLRPDGTFADANEDNYLKLSPTDGGPAKCHQVLDMTEKGECWIVDTGGGCIRKMAIHKADGVLKWAPAGDIPLLSGHGPRQIVLSQDGRHLYTLHARSCLVSHHDLSLQDDDQLVSTHNILPGKPIDLENRQPPYTIAAALSFHQSSSTLIATSRFVKDQPTDSVAFFHVSPDGKITSESVLQPKRGKEFRGVGLFDNYYVVAGQSDGWLSCFEWTGDKTGWIEREFEPLVQFEKVVDIKAM